MRMRVTKEIEKHTGKDKQKGINKESESSSNKRTSQTFGISVENKDRNNQTRRKLKYLSDIRRNIRSQEKTSETQETMENMKRKGSNQRKRAERLNSIEYSTRKKKNSEKQQLEEGDKTGKNQPELWSKVIGRREKKQNKRREEVSKTNKRIAKRRRKEDPSRLLQ